MKLVISLLRTDILLTVLIKSSGLVKDQILYTRGKRCVEHVANRGERCVQVLVGKVDAKDYLKDLGVDGWIILKWFFKEWGGDVE